jgi:hypothetical protein
MTAMKNGFPRSQSARALNRWVQLPGTRPADSERPQMRARDDSNEARVPTVSQSAGALNRWVHLPGMRPADDHNPTTRARRTEWEDPRARPENRDKNMTKREGMTAKRGSFDWGVPLPPDSFACRAGHGTPNRYFLPVELLRRRMVPFVLPRGRARLGCSDAIDLAVTLPANSVEASPQQWAQGL